MSIIIDANCATQVLTNTPAEDFAPVLEAILTKGLKMALGGSKLRTEYVTLATVWKFIVALDRAGKAATYPDADVDLAAGILDESGALNSDDPHIIALAQVSGARLLCSRDKNLHKDFLSKELISKPRGNVYQNASHVRLLRKHSKA